MHCFSLLTSRRQKKGKYTRLVGRHANYSIGHRAADRWVDHMDAAMEEHSILKDDLETREKLSKYFRYTAHYIVVSSVYMRSDQVCPFHNRDEVGIIKLSPPRSLRLLTELLTCKVERWDPARPRPNMVVSHDEDVTINCSHWYQNSILCPLCSVLPVLLLQVVYRIGQVPEADEK